LCNETAGFADKSLEMNFLLLINIACFLCTLRAIADTFFASLLSMINYT